MPFDVTGKAVEAQATLEIAVVTGISDSGELELSPPPSAAGSLVSLCQLTAADVGQLVLLQSDGQENGVSAVLGKLSQTPQQLARPINKAFSLQAETNDEPLVFQAGKSRLELQPYGKIRLISDNVQLRARRHMDIQGAWIDLN